MYEKITLKYGNRIEVIKCHTWRCSTPGEKRNSRANQSSEKQQKQNEKRRQKNLERLLIGNFSEEDYHLVLTYRPEERPEREESKRILQKFFRGLRNEYKKLGLILKYVAVTEWESTHIHHHIVLTGCAKIGAVLRKLWRGGIHLEALYENKNFAGLAEYLIKETKKTFREAGNPWKQTYTCSRNLKKPEIHKEIVPAESWREEPQCPPALVKLGYYLEKDSVISGVNGDGYGYQTYCFVRC